MNKLNRCGRTLLVICCVVVIITPVILYYTLTANWGFDKIGGENAPAIWLGFWGSFIGAIASFAMIVVTLYILSKQLAHNQAINKLNRKSNQINNEENRRLQFDILRQNNAQRDLDDIKVPIANFQVSFNLLSIAPIIENITNKRYLKEDNNKLEFLIRDIDEKAFRLELSINKLVNSEQLNLFNKIYNEIYNEYTLLIADLIFFIDLMRNIPQEKAQIEKYVNYHINENRDKMLQNHTTLISAGIDISSNVQILIEQIGDYINIEKHIQRIVESRYNPAIIKISELKEQLKPAIIDLINSEQDIIDDMLIVNNTPNE